MAGGIFHVLARGNARARLFLDEFDYSSFLQVLGRVVERCRWSCLTYCLMPNHYHLVVETPEPNRGIGMRLLNGSFAQRFNARYDGSGHVFQGPYRSIPIERDAHLFETCRYVVLNPIRAGLSRQPEAWPWSSYRATVGLEPAPQFLAIRRLFELIGEPSPLAVERYRAFVSLGVSFQALAPDRVPGEYGVRLGT